MRGWACWVRSWRIIMGSKQKINRGVGWQTETMVRLYHHLGTNIFSGSSNSPSCERLDVAAAVAAAAWWKLREGGWFVRC